MNGFGDYSASHVGGGSEGKGLQGCYRPCCYQNKTGTVMANSHPGSYCGQDAYNDMFVVEKKYEKQKRQ